MTRKDFQLIADVISKHIRKHINHWEGASETLIEEGPKVQAYGGANALKDLATTFSYELEKTNPRFNKALFLKACGIS
jgi:hypothetical protein